MVVEAEAGADLERKRYGIVSAWKDSPKTHKALIA